MIPMPHDPVTSIYLSDSWKQHADLLLHLSEFSENVLLVPAPYQAGKTTFLEHIMQREHPTLNRVKIDAPTEASVDALIALVEAAFQEEPHRTPVLLIDDAHRLSDHQIEALLQLKFHLVLFSEPSLELRLFSSRWHDRLQGKIYTIELEPWSLEDIKTYWMNDPFAPRLTEDQFAVLLEESGGLPGEIVRYKAHVLSHTELRGNMFQNFQNIDFKKMTTHPISIGIFIGGLVGGSYLLFSGASEIESTMIPIEQADATEEKWESEALALPEPVAIATSELPTMPILEAVKETPKEIAKEIAKEMPKALPKETIKVVAKPKEIKKTEPAPKITARLTDQEKRLLQMRGHYYTLQLLGARDEKNIEQFISRHGIAKEAYCYRTKLSGKDWYVVVYGSYPSREAAKQAMASIPYSLKKENLKPWVRGVDSVQQDIQEHRQA